MTLTSLEFYVLFALSLVLYYIIPRSFQWKFLLFTSSLFFILTALPFTLVYVIITIVSVYFCTKNINKYSLYVGIIINIALLALLKYNIFITDCINSILQIIKISLQIPHISLASPLGISFYSFTAIGYLLDCYWGITSPQEKILKTALFIGYYPQLTSGPITRYSDMEAQLYDGHQLSFSKVTYGLQRMLWGIYKKLVISSRIGIIVDTIYSNSSYYNGFYIWLAALLFMFQLYTDFSGCMDIVIGVSECYGIILPENFHTPFFSCSIQEYWQRWHITLGGWLRDYIMYPIMRAQMWKRFSKWAKIHVGKKVARQFPSFFAMLCVWILMGLWHGGDWKFIVGMGVYFWSLIVLSQIFAPFFKKITKMFRINIDCFGWRLFQHIRVFILVSIGNMFFRLDGLIITIKTIKEGLHWNPWILFDGSLLSLGLDEANLFVILFSLSILLLVSFLQEKGKNVRQCLAKQNIFFRWIVWFGLIFGIIILGMYGPEYDAKAFIYEVF